MSELCCRVNYVSPYKWGDRSARICLSCEILRVLDWLRLLSPVFVRRGFRRRFPLCSVWVFWLSTFHQVRFFLQTVRSVGQEKGWIIPGDSGGFFEVDKTVSFFAACRAFKTGVGLRLRAFLCGVSLRRNGFHVPLVRERVAYPIILWQEVEGMV